MRKLLFFLFFIPFIINAQTTVTYPQRIANYYSSFSDGGGTFNSGEWQVGMWANTNATNKQTVSWRKFRTDGSNGSTSDRSMQLGDEFVVRLSATRAYGRVGIALLASPTTTASWADRENNYAISVNLDGAKYGSWGNWYIKYNGGSTSAASFGGDQTNYTSFTIAFTLVAENRMNIMISNGSTSSNFYDVELNSSNSITDYCIFLEDDWDGDNSSNVYWGLGAEGTQHSLANLGMCTFGQSNSSYTISSIITDGLEANSISTISKNDLIKDGTGTLTLSGSNSYTDITDIWEGTLLLGASGVIPDVSDLNLGGGIFSTGSGAGFAETAGKLIVQSASTINLGTGSHNLNFAATGEEDWGGNLSVTGWTGTEGVSGGGTAGKIFVGTDNTGLSSTNLGYIQFSGYPIGAVQKSDGEVVPAFAQAPSTNSSVPVFTNVYATKMNVAWTSGNGSNRIVVIREGSAVSWSPSNGTVYTADADFSLATDQGSGNKVCYNGSGNSFSLTGLTAGNTYHIAVFEFNGSSATLSYQTSGQLTGNQATSASYQSVSSGATNWNASSSWLDGVVPPSEALVVIDDDVVLNQNATVSSLTINSGAIFTASEGSNAHILTIADGGTLTNNDTFIASDGTVIFAGSGTVVGSVGFNDVSIAGGVNFGSSSTINNSLTILADGIVITNAPTFTTSSDLIFATGGSYNIENGTVLWTTGSVVGKGVPSNVIVSTTTPLNIYEARDVTGNLTINSGASVIQGNNDFIIHGNLINAGAFSFVADGAKPLVVMTDLDNQSGSTMALSALSGGDLKLQGDFDDNGTFTANGRAVFFQGSNDQNISSTTDPLKIDVMRIDKTGGEVILGQNLLADETADPLDIGDSDVLNLNGHKLTIGKTGVTSNITMSSGSKIVGSPTSSLTILGNGDLGTINFDQTTTGTTNALLNLTITREPGSVTIGNDVVIPSGGVWIINSQSALTVDGALTNNAGASGLVIKSTSSGTASLITNSTVTGNVTVERYIAGWSKGITGFHLLSSPVESQLISTEFVDVDANPIPATLDFYYWNEIYNNWINIKNEGLTYNKGTSWENFSNDANPSFAVGKGYLIGYSALQTKIFSGTLNTGDLASGTGIPELTYTSDQGNGWNLIGNPFPSAIDWDLGTWSRTNLNASVYVQNGTTGNYVSWNGTTGGLADGVIPAMQGFFVKADAAAASLTIPNASRVHSSSNLYKGSESKTADNVLVMQISTGNLNDQLYIQFASQATKNYDSNFDAYKLFGTGESPQIYSDSDDGKILSINALPEINEEMTIPVNIKVINSGTHEISLIENTLTSTSPILLVDRMENKTVDLTVNESYTFDAPLGFLNDRFYLQFKSTGISDSQDANQPIISIQNNRLNISNLDEGKVDVKILDIMGRVIDFRTFNTNSEISMPLQLKTGIYVLEITTNQSKFAHKVFIR